MPEELVQEPYDGSFCENSEQLSAVDYLRKKIFIVRLLQHFIQARQYQTFFAPFCNTSKNGLKAYSCS